VKCQQKLVCGLLNGAISNDLDSLSDPYNQDFKGTPDAEYLRMGNDTR